MKNVYKICFTKDWIFMRRYVYDYYVKQHPVFKEVIESQGRQIALLEQMNDVMADKEMIYLDAAKQLLKTIDTLMGELIIAGKTEEEIVDMLNANDRKLTYESLMDLIESSKK